jgi:hypothetical protein
METPLKVFAKRFWGFDPVGWPIISFGQEGNRDALIRASQPGDRIAFIGTQTEETAEEYRGRLLGLAEIGRIAIDSLDVLDRDSLAPKCFDNQGRFKWPKSLPMLRAWRFPDRPIVTAILKKQLTYEATVRGVLLDDDDTAAVLALPVEEVAVRQVAAITQQRALADALGRGQTRGPTPTSSTTEVTRDAGLPSNTYAFRFGGRDVWKIGHAMNIQQRLAEVNAHIPHEVLNERWSVSMTQRWPNQLAAYEMEQNLLTQLTQKRSEGERVLCTESYLLSAWVEALKTVAIQKPTSR